MAPTLVDTKKAKHPLTSWAAVAKSGLTAGGVKKSPLPSPKSPSRSSLRQKKKEPTSGPLPGTWEGFSSTTKPLGYKKEQVSSKTPEGVACRKLFRIHTATNHKELWGYHTERKAEHFYPGQIIRAMDVMSQTWFNAPLDDEHTASHKDGPIYAKRRPMVVLWKTKRELLFLPIRSLGNSTENFGKDPERWQEFISVTTFDDKDWPGKTPWAGPPLTFAAEMKGLTKQRYIQLTKPFLIQMQAEVHVDLGRLTGGSYCRLVEAYTYSQDLYKQKAFEEYGQSSKLPDGINWWEGNKSAEWKIREHQMDLKKPVSTKATKTYKLK